MRGVGNLAPTLQVNGAAAQDAEVEEPSVLLTVSAVVVAVRYLPARIARRDRARERVLDLSRRWLHLAGLRWKLERASTHRRRHPCRKGHPTALLLLLLRCLWWPPDLVRRGRPSLHVAELACVIHWLPRKRTLLLVQIPCEITLPEQVLDRIARVALPVELALPNHGPCAEAVAVFD